MINCYLFLILCSSVGSLGEREADKNRFNELPASGSLANHPSYSFQNRRSIDNNIYHTNDYDDYSSGFSELRPPLHILYPTETAYPHEEKIPIKIHQPREDPKLFYQSKAYLEEINGQNINHEVASIYPGREVVRADEKYRIPKNLLRSRYENNYLYSPPKICIQCPREKTLIAKKGVDRVLLQHPILKTCSGRKAPKTVRFVHMYGPKFATLLDHGTHVIVGRIMHNNETLHLCKMQVHVIIQTCSTPKYLVSHCDDQNKFCNFTCRDEMLELQGESALICGDDMMWEGYLPLCRARNWCKPIPPPEYGRISCRGTTTGLAAGMTEGSRCRIRCPLGWRWYPKSVAVCRRGNWTNSIKCIPKKNISR
ncbi:unnamed protein product, partial [Brenthis ino]